MSGHSKWATIKRKKASLDAKRGQAFTRLAKEIAIAARDGADPDTNFRLRLAVDKARAENMPKENIKRAIDRGAGLDKDAAALEEVMYEGYGPHGVAFLVSVVTDNRNRSLSEIRRSFSKAGGSMAAAGAVAWQFEPRSYFTLETEGKDADKLFDLAVESGADDVVIGEEMVEIFADPGEFQIVRESLLLRGAQIDSAELTMVPKTTVSLDEGQAFQNMRLISTLEELDDVQDVYSNLDITDELMARFEDQE